MSAKAPDSLSDGVDEELRLCGFEDGDPEPAEDPPPARDQQLRHPDDDVTRLPTEHEAKNRKFDVGIQLA